MYGQLINSVITALMVWAVLALVGLPGAFVMALLMLVLNMIPTIGPILAAVPGVLAALIQGSDRLDVGNLAFGLIVAGIYVVVVQVQANLIAPRVMGSAVNLRPAVIMIGLILGLQIGGLLGSLLAVPVIATAREVVRYLYVKLIDRDPWEPISPAEPEPIVATAS
jgi:predicted PurR-regulated permease PerM